MKTDNKFRRLRWLCRCSCGKEVLIPRSQLKQGQTACKSCTTIRVQTLPDSLGNWNRITRVYKRNAKNRGLSFSLLDSDVRSLCESPCWYCGSTPKEDSLGIVRNTIDRIDSSVGDTADNTVPCCLHCNIMKMDTPVHSFLDKIHQIHNYQKRSEASRKTYTQVGGNGEEPAIGS